MSSILDVRKAALLACLTSTFQQLWLIWSTIQNSSNALFWINVVSIVSIGLAPVFPIFYWALYRNEPPLRFESDLRKLSQIGAILVGIVIAVDLPGFVDALTRFDANSQPMIWILVTIVGELSSITYLLLLIAIYRAPSDEAFEPTNASGLLGVTSRVALLFSGLLLVLVLLKTGIAPYGYWAMREQIQKSGQDPEPEILRFFLKRTFPDLLSAAGTFAVPYIVCIRMMRLKTNIAQRIHEVEYRPGAEQFGLERPD